MGYHSYSDGSVGITADMCCCCTLNTGGGHEYGCLFYADAWLSSPETEAQIVEAEAEVRRGGLRIFDNMDELIADLTANEAPRQQNPKETPHD